jgi:ATP/maltotriose-dependent transcriptional regulator MalT
LPRKSIIGTPDDVTVLRQGDLAFAPDETRALLEEVSGRSLTEGQLDALFTRTEGWPAGVQMAAVWLRWWMASRSRWCAWAKRSSHWKIVTLSAAPM